MELTIRLAKKALTYRRVEEKLLDLFKKGKLSGTVHTSIGQEITPVLLHQYLRQDDYKFSNHRGHSHYMAATDDVEGLIKELLGKIDGCAGGYGGSQHLYNKKNNFYSNGIQGGMTPIAVGVAMELKDRKEGLIACVYIGDGTLGQGVFYEAINICGIFQLPVLFVCEDNGIAQSTLTSEFKLDRLEERVRGFSCDYYEGNTDDWLALNNIFQRSVDQVRQNTPVFLRVKTRRLMSHSKGDDNRSDIVLDDNFKNDPLSCFLKSELSLQEYDKLISNDLEELVKKCLDSKDLTNVDSYSYFVINDYRLKVCDQSEETVRQRINCALASVLDEDGFLIGEDVRNKSGRLDKEYGGAFKVTGRLSDRYPDQVFNMPISEQAIIGVSAGLALTGRKSVAEIMFGDFMTLTVDQIYQHISKMRIMYGVNVDLPILIRSPMGGRRGYGPTHSQSIERFFLGVPGVRVSSVNRYSPVVEIVEQSMKESIPQIMFEHKLNHSVAGASPRAMSYDVLITDDFSKTIILTPNTKKPKVTILTYGYGLELVEEIISEKDVSVEVVCPTVISPLNILPIVKSVSKTGKLFVLEEGFDSFGVSAAVVLELTKHGLSFELIESSGNGSVIPASYLAELTLLNRGLESLSGYIENA